MTVSHPHPGGAAAGHGAAHPIGATGAGSVVLELGGHIGALVLHVPARLHGTEIEISPEGDGPHGHRTHSLVRERVTAAGTSYAAVYPGIPAGRYTIWGEDGVPVGTAVISGGTAAPFRWPE
jgi:hypothetical protein